MDAKHSARRYGLDYMSIYREGFMVPIVDLACQFKQPLSFGEEAIVETRYIACDAAKIQFEYTIYRCFRSTHRCYRQHYAGVSQRS